VLGVSADPPKVNSRFQEKYQLPFEFLSDPLAELATALGVPLSTKHPMAKVRKYTNGFTQPAVFILEPAGNILFSWVQNPKITNLFGATRRMEPDEILSKVQEVTAG